MRATRIWWRPALGVVMAAAALAIVFNLDQTLQTHLGSYTTALQKHTEETGYATRHLGSLKGTTGTLKVTQPATATKLPVYGSARSSRGSTTG